MSKCLIVIASLVLASPAVAGQVKAPVEVAPAGPQVPAPAKSSGISGLVDGMPVISSDGAKVAEVAHLYKKTAYGPDETFFTKAPIELLRRIYGREAYVENGRVKLRMTAAQFRARNQNPPDWVNGAAPRR